MSDFEGTLEFHIQHCDQRLKAQEKNSQTHQTMLSPLGSSLVGQELNGSKSAGCMKSSGEKSVPQKLLDLRYKGKLIFPRKMARKRYCLF